MLEVILVNQVVWNFESFRMCVLRCFSQHPENLYRRTFVSNEIGLRWSWKIELSENINFDLFRMCMLRCFCQHPENLYRRTSVLYKICLRWSWKIMFSQISARSGSRGHCRAKDPKPECVTYLWNCVNFDGQKAAAFLSGAIVTNSCSTNTVCCKGSRWSASGMTISRPWNFIISTTWHCIDR